MGGGAAARSARSHGSDVLATFREKVTAWTKTVDEWEAVMTSVNFD